MDTDTPTTTPIKGMTEAQAGKINTALTGFGGTLLDNIIDLVPSLAALAAIMFVISIVRHKVHA